MLSENEELGELRFDAMCLSSMSDNSSIEYPVWISSISSLSQIAGCATLEEGPWASILLLAVMSSGLFIRVRCSPCFY